MKTTFILLLGILLTTTAYSQKPKKTHNHEKFAKKAMMSMAYIEKMCADEAALNYVQQNTGTSLEELKSQQEQYLKQLKADVNFIIDNGIYGTMGAIELTNVKEGAPKKADIVVNYKNNNGNYQLTLTNCIQTNISWYMGDAIIASGEGIEGIIAKREEKKEKAENGLWGKLNEMDQKQQAKIEEQKKAQARLDSINALRKGHLAKLFPMQGTDESSKYYKHELTNMPLKGYYVTNTNEIVEAVIAYQKPEFLVGDIAEATSLFICKDANGKKVDVLNSNQEPNFKKFVQKSSLKAFYVGDQLYANVPNVGWRIVTSEGAIHTFVSIVKIDNKNGVNYQAFEQTQKMNESAVGSVFGGPSSKVVLEMMDDCPEMVERYNSGELTLYETIVKYNYWYDLAYPEKVKYLPLPNNK